MLITQCVHLSLCDIFTFQLKEIYQNNTRTQWFFLKGQGILNSCNEKQQFFALSFTVSVTVSGFTEPRTIAEVLPYTTTGAHSTACVRLLLLCPGSALTSPGQAVWREDGRGTRARTNWSLHLSLSPLATGLGTRSAGHIGADLPL